MGQSVRPTERPLICRSVGTDVNRGFELMVGRLWVLKGSTFKEGKLTTST